MLVTPASRRNELVCKEYVAARIDGDGTLVLSGSLAQLVNFHNPWLVNPYDADGVKEAVVAATTASSDERQRRMRAMRQHLVEHDVQRWAREFLERLNAPDNQTRPENSMNGSKADFTHRGRSNNDR